MPQKRLVWRLSRRANSLLLGDGEQYWIDLDRCRTSAEVLDWIAQVSHKTWATDEILADLVRGLDRVLHLQQNLCGCGADNPITDARVSELVDAAR